MILCSKVACKKSEDRGIRLAAGAELRAKFDSIGLAQRREQKSRSPWPRNIPIASELGIRWINSQAGLGCHYATSLAGVYVGMFQLVLPKL